MEATGQAHSNEHPEFEQLLTEVEERATAGGLDADRRDSEDGSPRLEIVFGDTTGHRPVFVSRPEQAVELLATPFEQYRTVPGYEAIFNGSQDEIEVRVRPNGPFSPSFRNRLPFDEVRRMVASGAPGGHEIELATASAAYVAIGPGPRIRPRIHEGAPVLRLRGFGVDGGVRARQVLDDLAPTVLFELDIVYNLALEIPKVRDRRVRAMRALPSSNAPPEFPKNVYDEEPVALYMYARSARGMPLLEYLAYYQSIEFYFPRYSAEEVRRRVEGIVKDPRFNPHLDRDIGRLVEVVQGRKGRTYGSELDQLKATLQSCVEPEEVKAFVEEDEQRAEVFRDRRSPLTPRTISLADRNTDLRDAAAARIYDLRCRIVHSKDEPDEDQERLLPNSPEVHMLGHDLTLLRLLAIRVIVASSRELVL